MSKLWYYLLAGSFVRLFIGIVKFIAPSLFVLGPGGTGLGTWEPQVELLLMPLYVGVWVVGLMFEQGANLLTGNADEGGQGLADIISSVIWIVGLVYFKDEFA